jgi:hypothetical protein
MMPEKDWNAITDDWAEHDFARGNGGGDVFPELLASRYGKFENLADFVRKSQLATYEGFHAMYEGRNAEMFRLTTGIMTWMSNPAQPSFVWQIYHYDLEPNAAFFAVQNASEPIHVQFNEVLGTVQVVNNTPEPVQGAVAHFTIYNLDGSMAGTQDFPVDAKGAAVTDLGQVHFPDLNGAVQFLKLRLDDASGKQLSQNFYWHTLPERQDDFSSMDGMPTVELTANVMRADADGKSLMTVTLHNPTQHVAVMTHLQLHRKSGARVLPVFYSDNYISLVPGETRTATIEAATSDLHGEDATVQVDGWNVSITPVSSPGVAVTLNENAQVGHWPKTGLPFQTQNLR